VPDTGSRPDPDPTLLTTAALQREIEAVKSLLRDKVEARHTEQLALVDLLQSQIEALSAITTEKLNSVDKQFDLVERQRVEQKADTKAAVDAALIAQKEAVKEQTIASEKSIAKSEASTNKQLEELSKTFVTANDAQSSALADAKDRIGRIENVKVGGTEQIKAIYAFAGFLLVLIALGGVLAAAGVFQ
jgi:hypothetical protein